MVNFRNLETKTSSDDGPANLDDMLQEGTDMIASGYCVYGSATQFVFSAGKGVNCYALNPSLGEFVLAHPLI